MIILSLTNLRNVIAGCIACSLLLLPSSLTTAQDLFGTFDENTGNKVEPAGAPVVQEPTAQEPAIQEPLTQEPVTQEPATQEPAVVTLPRSGTKTGDLNDTDEANNGNTETDEAGESSTAETDEAGGSGTTEAELTLEERRADWMAELEQLTFSELVQRIRDDERKIDQLYINLPLGFPAQLKQFENNIDALKFEVIALKRLLQPAALEAFRSDPTGSHAAATKVFEVLASKLSPQGRDSQYDPEEGLRLVNTILEIKGGDIGIKPGVSPAPEDAPFLQVIFQGYLACYGLQDFEKANEYLTRLENTDIGLDPKLRENFQATVDAWEKEKVIRDNEAKADDLPRVKLETTNGDVVIELFENEAPNTVANFIKLTKDGYYDGLEFFHVVPSSYARSGCSANDGTTHPGYRIRNEYENGRHHFAGTVVMQNDGENTAGSQFVILHRPDPYLLEKVVAFGRVIEGLDIVYGFKTVNRIRITGGEATVINKATVLRDRGHEYEPDIIEEASLIFKESGLSSSTSGGSSKRPLNAAGGSSKRPLNASGGSSKRPLNASGGSSKRPLNPGGSSTRPSAVGGSSSRPKKSGGSSSRARPTNGSYSQPSSTNGSYSRPR